MKIITLKPKLAAITVKPKDISTFDQNSSAEYSSAVENTEDDLSTFVTAENSSETKKSKIKQDGIGTTDIGTTDLGTTDAGTTDFTTAIETSSNYSDAQGSTMKSNKTTKSKSNKSSSKSLTSKKSSKLSKKSSKNLSSKGSKASMTKIQPMETPPELVNIPPLNPGLK